MGCCGSVLDVTAQRSNRCLGGLGQVKCRRCSELDLHWKNVMKGALSGLVGGLELWLHAPVMLYLRCALVPDDLKSSPSTHGNTTLLVVKRYMA